MGGVLIGFSLVWAVIALGYLLGRFNVLGDGAQRVLSRFTFFVASPALLFETISRADLHTVFGPSFWIASGEEIDGIAFVDVPPKPVLMRHSSSVIWSIS